MSSIPMKRAALPALFLFALVLALAGAEEKQAGSSRLLAPVFPYSPPGIVYVEGEDAVSTNMATEPTLNYGCSGNRSLQLSRAGQLPGGSAFYAEYCFYVDRAGRYELWYSGTPPGSKDEFAVSFASPLSVQVDGGPARSLYREDVNVVERLSPSYYWMRTFALELSQGAHVIRFEVSSKRKLDDRFFIYLDALFLASSEALASVKADRTGLPELFPKDPSDRGIDHPFRSYEDYQAQIQATPTLVGPYVELADEYSLAGNYLDALKILSKAAVVAPRDPDVRLLAAKNRIWRGDIKEGIEAYGIYMSLRPDDLGAYEEAGKVAAWSGRYSDADYFYATGLAAFPGNPSLSVNRDLARLWAGRVGEAERGFAEAEKAALADPAAASNLALVYRSNGFPDRALAVYERAIAAFPDHLGFYLDEGALLASQGKDKEAGALESRIAAAFESSPELDAALATARARRMLKADRIASLEAGIAAKPDDLGLRDELTRVYAWNGRMPDAARQLESILAARFARVLSESDTAASAVFSGQFSAAALQGDIDARLSALAGLAAKAQAADAAAAKALALVQAGDKAVAAAEAGAKAAPPTDEARASARAAALASLSALADAIVALEAEEARASLISERAAGIKSAFDSALSRDDADEKAFRTVVSGLGWSFDPAWASSELGLPAARGEQIAALARARVLIGGLRDDKAARAALATVSSDTLAADRRRAELMILARRDYRALYKAALEAATAPEAQASLAAAVSELAVVAAAPAPAVDESRRAPSEDAEAASIEAYASALREELASASGAFARIKGEAAASRAALASVVQGSTAIEDRRLARAWYAFESGSLDLRAELGAYYDGLGQALSATRQYRRVLALDPANIRAMHSLALAEDKSGDWSAAASLFRAVNSADPYYGNAAALYNGIARRHAPSYDTTTTILAEHNLFNYGADASATFPLGSYLALKPSASIRSIRDWNLGFPAYLDGTVGMEIPISLLKGSGDDSLAIRPYGSLIATSADFSVTGSYSVTPAEFVGALSFYTAGGAAVDGSLGPWRGSLSYSYAPIPNSLNYSLKEAMPEIFQLFSHKVELSASAYLAGGGLLRYIAPRVYATGSYVPADGKNWYGTALAEVIPGFRLSDSPWMNLGIPLDLVYEDAKAAHTSPYYSADQALTAKGGLLWQSSFSLRDGSSLSLSVEGMGGLYLSRAFSDSPAKDLYLYGYARADWLRGGVTYSLSLEASATDPFAAIPKYWSFAIVGGVSAKQPALIAP